MQVSEFTDHYWEGCDTSVAEMNDLAHAAVTENKDLFNRCSWMEIFFYLLYGTEFSRVIQSPSIYIKRKSKMDKGSGHSSCRSAMQQKALLSNVHLAEHGNKLWEG